MAAGWVHPGYPRETRALPPTTPRIIKPQRRSAEESTLEKAARSPVSLDIAATLGPHLPGNSISPLRSIISKSLWASSSLNPPSMTLTLSPRPLTLMSMP